MSGHIESAAQSGTLPIGVTLLQKPFSREALSAALREARDAVGADRPPHP
jgi:hypothetical protein